MVPSAQYEQTKKTVDEFLKENGEGERLQKMLLELDQRKENWVSWEGIFRDLISPMLVGIFIHYRRLLVFKSEASILCPLKEEKKLFLYVTNYAMHVSPSVTVPIPSLPSSTNCSFFHSIYRLFIFPSKN